MTQDVRTPNEGKDKDTPFVQMFQIKPTWHFSRRQRKGLFQRARRELSQRGVEVVVCAGFVLASSSRNHSVEELRQQIMLWSLDTFQVRELEFLCSDALHGFLHLRVETKGSGLSPDVVQKLIRLQHMFQKLAWYLAWRLIARGDGTALMNSGLGASLRTYVKSLQAQEAPTGSPPKGD